jgi:hypothetical protein
MMNYWQLLIVMAMSDDAGPILGAGAAVYKSYLLRVWRDVTPGARWRATLECVTVPQERQNFPDVDSLVAFLLATFEDGLAVNER